MFLRAAVVIPEVWGSRLALHAVNFGPFCRVVKDTPSFAEYARAELPSAQ
ncbi:hypothetical protein BRCON_2031 [Candidatus Sumerlaea chitinivorans]|uniref:Uncharacterized protein n=1 Tax=Sumerlaea chitinivorans TaxID=2250252 RepID=A0A2Z4Y7I4_SUMC1|nr:hypothetical protein BRCON_2031 [Candidatus Sumerlaea chitinivorans]